MFLPAAGRSERNSWMGVNNHGQESSGTEGGRRRPQRCTEGTETGIGSHPVRRWRGLSRSQKERVTAGGR